jgi:hypothetical protein
MTTAASLLADVVTYELTRSPVKAARLGLTVPGPLLPDVSEAAVTGYARDDGRGSRGCRSTSPAR